MCNKKNSPEIIEKTIQAIMVGIPGSRVEVSDLGGTSNHLEILVVNKAFEGIQLIAQHRMVMDLLKDSLKSEIHAVVLKTKSAN